MTLKKTGHRPRVLAADTLTGDKVVNMQEEDLGKIEHLMMDLDTGRIAYAVLSFGRFLGMGGKLFAIPWGALTVDKVEKRFILKVDKERLNRAPGFDKDHWPNMADPAWSAKISSFYDYKRPVPNQHRPVINLKRPDSTRAVAAPSGPIPTANATSTSGRTRAGSTASKLRGAHKSSRLS
ncbi:MAG TPA: PRC-barrel domain-containing protein [Terriglobia bacterium]|nr:PRC-barrel domain-containing protein [Terriglobia bacterium]